MLSRISTICVLLLLIATTSCRQIEAVDKGALRSPWGVSSHTHKNPKVMHIEIQKCKEAGITWLRDDFQFSNIAKEKGKYDFEIYDKLLELSSKENIEILAILQGFDWEIKKNRPDAVPLYNNPEKWRNFVRAVVSRYHEKIKHWEIWNEQDGGFWKPKPDASQYVKLLKIAYEEIKKIDPNAQVFVGGLCGWNSSYLQQMYDAGAHSYFDGIAVHPYKWGPDALGSTKKVELEKFKKLMAKHGDADKKIIITESGGSTCKSVLMDQSPKVVSAALRLAMEKINRHWTEDKPLVVGIPVSVRFPNNKIEKEKGYLPGAKIISITRKQLKTLSPSECPVLLIEGEHIEEPYMEPVRDYIKRGGILLASSSVPFYSLNSQQKDGTWVLKNYSSVLHPYFRFAYEAWWTTPKLPKNSRKIHVCKALQDKGISASKGYASRYVSGKNLKEGDTYLPLIKACNDNGEEIADAMALYTYKDWKGALLACTLNVSSGFSESTMANLIQRMYLSYLSMGVKRIFVYDLRCDGTEPGEREDNFGLLRRNWQPKPAYLAYKEMTEALGETPIFKLRWTENVPEHIWALIFARKEDSRKVLAIWSVDPDKGFVLKNKKTDKKILRSTNSKVHFIELDSPISEYEIIDTGK